MARKRRIYSKETEVCVNIMGIQIQGSLMTDHKSPLYSLRRYNAKPTQQFYKKCELRSQYREIQNSGSHDPIV